MVAGLRSVPETRSAAVRARIGYRKIVTRLTFGEQDLAEIDSTLEMRIETSPERGAAVRSAVIWAVVVDARVFIRSFRGVRGRWYRDVVANPESTLIVGGRRIRALAEPAVDAGSIDACSRGLKDKYSASPSLPAMLTDEVLATTIELLPADGPAEPDARR
jgi:hypothetical protein